jgi:hypothetical protein
MSSLLAYGEKMDTGVLPMTDWLTMDEPAFWLLELELPAPDFKSRRRYQFIHVWRGEGVSQHKQDMGPVTAFLGAELNIPAGWLERSGDVMRLKTVETVGSLRDAADQVREVTKQDMLEVLGRGPDMCLWDKYLEEMDYRYERRLHPGKEVYGYGS